MKVTNSTAYVVEGEIKNNVHSFMVEDKDRFIYNVKADATLYARLRNFTVSFVETDCILFISYSGGSVVDRMYVFSN